MDEEEKKAIDYFKNLDISFNTLLRIDLNGFKYKLDTILNLIENQQKEIEELKHDNSILCEIAYTGKRIQPPYTMVYTGTDNFISKDKIKEKIEEITKEYYKLFEEKRSLDFININGHRYNAMKLVLEELLGE